jgi:hypothetical protein
LNRLKRRGDYSLALLVIGLLTNDSVFGGSDQLKAERLLCRPNGLLAMTVRLYRLTTGFFDYIIYVKKAQKRREDA